MSVSSLNGMPNNSDIIDHRDIDFTYNNVRKSQRRFAARKLTYSYACVIYERVMSKMSEVQI